MSNEKKDAGYKDEHHLIEERVPPPSVIALREEMALPHNKDIYDEVIKGRNFEECLGILAAKLDIVLDGLYDASSLCEVLFLALKNRKEFGAQPHLRVPGLVQAEIQETAKEIKLVRANNAPMVAREETKKKAEAKRQRKSEKLKRIIH
jgi:hypothetical protein